MPIWQLPDQLIFPHPLTRDPQGILAIGGDISPERLLLAYIHGIFPWNSPDEPLIWWFPDPRCVLVPGNVIVSHSMRSMIRKSDLRVTTDTAFSHVLEMCRIVPRKGQDGTWLYPELMESMLALHEEGFAHSVEVWKEDALVGGLYGLAYGKVFFGESMFAVLPNASKYALMALDQLLVEKNFRLIDCQQDTPHLRSLGATLISAEEFHHILQRNRLEPPGNGKWYNPSIQLHL